MKKRNTKRNLHIGKLAPKIPKVQKVIKDRMNHLGLTVYAVSKATGISHQTMANFVKGTHSMRSDKLAAVLVVLGMEIRVKE